MATLSALWWKSAATVARFGLALALLTALSGLPGQSVRASEIWTVTSTADGADVDPNDNRCDADAGAGIVCTLRAAIQQANARNQGDQIILGTAANDVLTFTLSSGLGALVITTTLSISSPGGGGLRIVDGAQLPINTPVLDLNAPALSLTGLTVTGGKLGGLAIRAGASVTVTNSTIADNANYGLYVVEGGTLTLVNSTVSGNSGGGIVNGFSSALGGLVSLNQVTVTGNFTPFDAGGIRNNGGTVRLRNSIVAGNVAGLSGPDCFGALISDGHNLLGNNHGCTGLTNGVNGDQVGSAGTPLNALLGNLQNNGGPSETHALLAGSPALNAGDPNTCPATDQRGAGRPQGGGCDIGAYEMPTVMFAQSAFVASDTASVAALSARLEAAAPFGVSVDYATSNGTALAGVDYTARTGSLTVNSPTPLTFTVPITGSPLYTGDRSFNVSLAAPPGAGVGAPGTATVTIVDTQPPPQTVFASGTYTTLKSAGAVTALVSLNTISGVTATVNYATVNGTAHAGVDFAPASGTLIFPPGQTTRPVTVTLLNASFYTGDKTFSLALSQPVSASLGAPGSTTIELVDDNPRRVFLPVVTRGPDFYASPCETEPNNLVTQANGPLQSGRPVCGNYNGVNVRDDDYFYFETRNPGPITIRVDNAIRDLQVQLFYQTTGNFLGFSASPPFEISYPSGIPGRYYVRVVMPAGYSGGPYSLNVTYP